MNHGSRARCHRDRRGCARADRDAAGPQRLSGPSGGPGGLSERHSAWPLHPPSRPARLREWGLLERVVATGCPPAPTITLDTGEGWLVGRDLVVDGVAAGYGPRRAALDQVLIDGAVAAGAELRAGFAVQEYLTDRDRIVGIRGRDRAGGAPVTQRATITVGADGRGSRLARTVQAPEYEVTLTLTCWYFSYWESVAASGLELYVRPERMIFAFPTNDGLFAIFVAWPIGEQRAIQREVERQFIAVIDLVPDLGRARAGRAAGCAVLGCRRPAELSAPALRSGLGPGRRCRLPQGPLHGTGHLRRLPRRRSPCRRDRRWVGWPAHHIQPKPGSTVLSGCCLKHHPLDLIQAHRIAGAIIELGRARARMCGHHLGLLQGAAVGEIDGDPGRPEGVAADLGRDPGRRARR